MSDCSNAHLSAYDRAAQEDRERSADSREKLEADITTYLLDKVATWSKTRYELNNEIIGWLDRQAAITEREVREKNLANWQGLCDELGIPCIKDKAGEQFKAMQDRIDELEAENARLRSRISDDVEYGRLVMDAYRELRAKLDEIAKVVDA